MNELREKIETAINQECAENESNTPDFILADYLISCLEAFDIATKRRDKWYGVHLEPINKYFEKVFTGSQEKNEIIDQSLPTHTIPIYDISHLIGK